MKKFMILILLASIAAALFFAYMQQAKRDIKATIGNFFTTAISGNPEAEKYLDLNGQEEQLLLEALKIPDLWTLQEVKQIRITSLRHAAVRMTLTVGDQTRPIEAMMLRKNGKWQIIALPKLSVLPNALITQITGEDVTLIHGQNTDEITLKSELTLSPQDAGFAVEVDGALIYFEPFTQVPVNKLLALSGDTLEGEQSGSYELAEDTVFFQKLNGSYKRVDAAAAIIGMKNVILYQKGQVVQNVLLPDDYRPERIRVLLNTTGFNGLSHNKVRLSATTSFELEDKVAGNARSFAAGQIITITAAGNNMQVTFPSGDSKTYPNRLHIIPDGSGRIKVESLRRGSPAFTPAYRGTIEIATRNDALLIVNEVPMESYLYSVVPSEMPVSFGEVPLQVQAVAARSYAVASIYRSGLKAYGAHVDDSVSSQVYNNVPEYAISTAAVDATKGMVVKYEDSIADTRFFSTSSGVTANFDEVWHDEKAKKFPGTPLTYLTSRSQLRSGALPDVKTEDGASKFFTSADWNAYDQSSPWFRWQVEMSRTQLEAVLNKYLADRQKAQPEFVLTNENGSFVSKPIPANPIGKLKDLRVIKRGKGGNLMELEVVGENGTYRLIKEYTIRFTIRPVNADGGAAVLLRRHDGSTLKNYAILPSTFVVFDVRRDSNGDVGSIIFKGGGNGHGVGMSQYGTRGLAEVGYQYQEILLHYYSGCSVEKAY